MGGKVRSPKRAQRVIVYTLKNAKKTLKSKPQALNPNPKPSTARTSRSMFCQNQAANGTGQDLRVKGSGFRVQSFRLRA